MTKDDQKVVQGPDGAGRTSRGREQWRRPEFRKLEAREAETGFNNGADNGFS